MEKNQKEIKIGEPGYVNKNCWLARNVGHPPAKRCQYCESKFPNCLFFRYLIITLALVIFIIIASFLLKENISKLVVVSVFSLVLVYGYFFSKSTEDIIIANFFQRKAKESFEDLSKTLQQKVDEQTKDIKQAYETEKKAHEQLKKVDDAKTQFLVLANHHLRTPLTGINWYLELLASGKFGKIPIKIKEILEKIESSAASELKIVDDLLNISRYQLGTDTIILNYGVDLKSILDQIIQTELPVAEKNGIKIKFDADKNIFIISADESKLKFALANILDNAIRYTQKGKVAINLENKKDKFLIKIEDTGIGLDENEKESIFKETFFRGKEAQNIFATGEGIGLYLSAKIIEAHKGKIWTESKGRNKGSTFYIELPM